MLERNESDRIYDMVTHGNEMTLEDLKQFIEIVFLDVSSQQVSQLTQSLGNIVTRDDFNSILDSLVLKRTGNLDVFNSWDRDQKGHIDKNDVEAILKSYGLSFKESYIDAMLGIFKDKKMRFDDLNSLCKEK
ncbi:CALCIUM-BINDING PROTEIN SIMILAR TO MYOSIN REGULATORY LIGHT CHAIN 2 [Encephalitozoon cuniculi GB-M1]|uniref:Calcium-binding protein n=2 Tax=Encephalitozoon cuniculi TaxID=6035 RepID=M1JKR9_ENCCN|nr:uncharacterized protein ECU01_1260 [Encephalitozoon cuniculi GB-M1]AGE96114.1 calcium-binding protein [Encephalitozoon cuniculi]KMV66782.1 hypothetical protein M970_011120 [Encephalitozoon cuniculi EcunIII-L]UYI28500.1 putative calmodulin [Encephalitozoon cuniculi]CAD24999.1 CALCIUM-BINDING PROTEIN SIMILAR TO MYOSIN REGULATORY LIGHT CHAIN 2 [Encephalitozoon cuniculi GB-M1]